jgi:hypothetical protein
MAAAWDELPNVWRKYECDVPVNASGTLELQIIAPSSHGAPPGRIWIDDIALYEIELPAKELVSGGVGFNDEPAMGKIVWAWILTIPASALVAALCQWAFMASGWSN